MLRNSSRTFDPVQDTRLVVNAVVFWAAQGVRYLKQPVFETAGACRRCYGHYTALQGQGRTFDNVRVSRSSPPFT